MSTVVMRDYASPEQIAKRLGVSTKTVRRMCKSGTLPAHKVERRVMIALEDAEALVRRSKLVIQSASVTRSALNDDGRALTFSAAELRSRARMALAALDDPADAEEMDEVEADHLDALHASLELNRVEVGAGV